MKDKKKVYNKSQKNKMNKKIVFLALLLVLVAVVVIVIINFNSRKNVTNSDENYFDSLSPEEKSAISGNSEDSKNVVFDNSGTKLNMSNGINKTIKLNDNILVDNILLFASEGKSVVSFNVNNTSNSIYSKSKLQIKLLDDENSVVYSCQKDTDHCVAFFNPTNIPYDYHLDQQARILFDNGSSNPLDTFDIHIAAFSVVVCQIGLTA